MNIKLNEGIFFFLLYIHLFSICQPSKLIQIHKYPLNELLNNYHLNNTLVFNIMLFFILRVTHPPMKIAV